MLEKTEGVVLHILKYSDSADIVSVYTALYGKLTFMVYRSHKKKSKFKSAFFQPLSLLDIDLEYKQNRDFQTLKEVRTAIAFKSIPFSPVKNAIALFLSEVLFRALHNERDEFLFEYLKKSIVFLDDLKEGTGNFHLLFLFGLSRHLGFEPNPENGDAYPFFDLLNGVFCPIRPLHRHFAEGETAKAFYHLSHANWIDAAQVVTSRSLRAEVLNKLMEYYQLHVPDFRNINSLEVLYTIFA